MNCKFRTIVALCFLISVSLSGCADSSVYLHPDPNAEEQERRRNTKGPVVYAVQDILEDSSIKSDQVEVRQLQLSKTPQDSITDPSLVIGRRAKYGMSAGQIIGQHDIVPNKTLEKE